MQHSHPGFFDMGNGSVHFGDFDLDAARFQLRHKGLVRRLERKPFDLLVLLVESDGRLVTRGEIAERLWGKDVFVDTEHGINTAVRKLRAVLRDDPDHPRFLETVTGLGYRFIAPVERLVHADPPAPAEATHAARPTDLTSELPAAVTQPLPDPKVAEIPALPRRLTFLSVALAVAFIPLIAVLWATHNRSRNAVPQPHIRSVAVLPLSNFSGDPRQDYLADGMTDELITELARNSTLRIPSRTSAMHFKRTEGSLAEIAHALEADAIVEGSVSRAADAVHLNLQLIRVDTDSHLWAESYTRDPAAAVSLPAEAARDISLHLHSPLVATLPHPHVVSPEAHDAWLLGHYLWSVDRNDEAGKAFEHAVALDPDYALGWTGISQYYGRGALRDLEPSIALPRERQAAERALALDPNLPEAHSMMAAALFFGDHDPEAALSESIRANQLDPSSSESWHLEALILSALGRSDEAIAVQRRGTAADPLTHPAALAEIFLFARRYAPSIAEARLRLRDLPGSRDLLETLVEALHETHRDAEAAPYAALLYSPEGKVVPNPEVVAAFQQGGYPQFLRWNLARMQQALKLRYRSPMNLAHGYAELGEREEAFRQIDKALALDDPRLLFIRTDPAYDSLHTDPRYKAILERFHLRDTANQ